MKEINFVILLDKRKSENLFHELISLCGFGSGKQLICEGLIMGRFGATCNTQILEIRTCVFSFLQYFPDSHLRQFFKDKHSKATYGINFV